jgi:hypothetical protein
VMLADGAAALAATRAIAGMAGVEGAERLTLKVFRASRATAMARAGCSLGEILIAGEWRSSAFARYVDIDSLNPVRALETAMETSDNEANDE